MLKGEIVEPRQIIKANNDLFRVRCKIKDVVAGRIFMAFASLVDENNVKDNERFVEYKISVSSVLNDINAGGDNYRQIRDAAYSLIDQKLEKRRSKNSFKIYTLFSSIDYSDGIITGEFHRDLVPFFIAARGVFTRLNLQQYMKLPSIYSQKIFGFLKSWDDKAEIKISLTELHDMLDTPNSFRSDFRQFRLRVLEKSHKDISKNTSLRYEWEPIKKGRAVVAVRFVFSRKLVDSITTAKTSDAQQRQVQKNNAIFIVAVNCLQEHGPVCEGGHQKKAICQLCRSKLRCE